MSKDEKIQLMEHFYRSFQQRDYQGMMDCYHPEIWFTDPAFGDLKGKQAGAMWHMLLERSRDLQLTFQPPQLLGEETGHVHWEATYTFSATKRHVHNILDATMRFSDGKIIRHEDQFDFWRWSRMALGTSGVLLGWTPAVHNKVRKTALEGLAAFIAKNPVYQ
jgi:ketosteroid isomerase-like protein